MGLLTEQDDEPRDAKRRKVVWHFIFQIADVFISDYIRTSAYLLIMLCIGISANAQLPNASFESWQQESGQVSKYRNPVGWSSANSFSSLSVQNSVVATDDAAAGDTAVFMETLPIGFGNVPYAGWIINGTPPIDTLNGGVDVFDGGTPINYKPVRLIGQYKYSRTDQFDSAEVVVFLKIWNGTKTDTVGRLTAHLGPTTNWTPFDLPITDLMPGIFPDTIVVGFFSSFQSLPKEGGDLWIDDLSLDSTVNRQNLIKNQPEAQIFPNPATGSATIRLLGRETAKSIEIHNQQGQILFKKRPSAGQKELEIDLKQLPDGLYFIRIQLKTTQISQKLLKSTN